MSADFIFNTVMSMILVFFIVLLTSILLLANRNQWVPMDNGCYLYKVDDRSLFGEDKKSTEIYCKK